MEPAMNPIVSGDLELVVTAIWEAARDTKIYELSSTAPLPAYEAGAHIDLHLPSGLIRSYSLIPSRHSVSSTYAIAVKRDPKSRGGSRFMHDELSVGDHICASQPRNNFPLARSDSHSVFFAGGIGITPIWSMIVRLVERRSSWSLFYSSKSRIDMAFLAELKTDHRAHLHFDDEKCGAFLDIAAIVRETPKGSHLYCCGPAP